MTDDRTLNERILHNLRETLDRVHRDLDKMDMWAAALGAFLQPIPDYQVSERFMLPVRNRSERSAREPSRVQEH